MTQTLTDQTARGHARRAEDGAPWVGGAMILLLTCAAYIPAMRGGFVWDDRDHLLRNPAVHAQNPVRIWNEPFLSFEYYPVTWTSYWLENRLWGSQRATGYHVVNVLVHACSAMLVWRVLLRLAIPAALPVALVFALHPVNVESVAWITQRKNVLSMFFMVAAVLAHLRYEDRKRAAWHWCGVALFALAMLSKAGIIGLPIVLVLIAWWRRGAVTRGDLWRALPYCAVAVALTLLFQQPVRDANVIGDEVVRDDGFLARLAGAGWAVWFYLYKAVLPFNLSFVYPRWRIDPGNPVVYAPGVALVAMLALCWRMRRRWGRPCLMALIYFVVMVGPALGFADFYYLRYSFVADHYQYYAIVGAIALIVPAVLAFLRRYEAALPGAVVLIAGCGVLTFLQATPYRTSFTLWRDTLRKNPGAWLAHHNLGNLYRDDGRNHKAIYHLERAVGLKPDMDVGHYNLGCALDAIGRHTDAIDQLNRAIELKATFAEAYSSLGLALRNADRVDEAIAQFHKAIEVQPDLLPAHVNLANALRDLGRLDDAVARLEHAIRLNDKVADVYYNLGGVLALQGKGDDAMRRFYKALEIDPMHPEAHNAVGNVLRRQGRIDAAINHFRLALQARPDMADSYQNWGLALAETGRVEQATERFRAALRLDPQSANRHQHLALALQVLGKYAESQHLYREALRLEPDFALAHNGLAGVFLVTGRVEQAMKHYREAMRIDPDLPEPWIRVAWLLATHPDDAVRDTDGAVRFAERASQLTGGRNLDALDALAAAYASAGEFGIAVATALRALGLPGSSNGRAEQIRDRLELYREGRAYRDKPAAGNPRGIGG